MLFKHYRAIILSVLLFILLLSVTMYAFYLIQKSIARQSELTFEGQASAIDGIIAGRVNRDIYLLYSLKGLYEASNSVERGEFKAFAEGFDIQKNFPGIYAIGFIQKVGSAEKDSYNATVLQDTSLQTGAYPDFAIFPDNQQENYYPLNYIYPSNAAFKQIGYDFGVDKKLNQVLQASLEKNSVVLSDRIMVEGEASPFYMILSPIYRNGQPTGTLEERQQSLQGFAAVIIKIDKFFDSILQTEIIEWNNFDLYIYDAAPGAAYNPEKFLYDVDKEDPDDNKAEDFQWSEDLPLAFADRTWTLHFVADEAYGINQLDNYLKWIFLIGGIIGSLLLTSFFYYLATSRRRALILAEEMTGKLKKSAQKERQRADELERLNQAMAGRELKMIELKKEIMGLSQQGKTANKNKALRQAEEMALSADDPEARQKAMLNILEDVEEERDRSQKLARDLEKFELAVANASDHIVITDAEGMIVYANKAVEKNTGFRQKELIGKKAGNHRLWGGLMGKKFYEKFWHTIKTEKKVFSGEIKNKHKDGEQYDAKISVAPIQDREGKVIFFVGIETDITQEKSIDRAKTEFVSLASHQLRTPLSAINWYTEMLMAGDAGKINKAQAEYLREVYHGSKRMVELVNSLLNVSRIELGTFAIEPEPVDVAEISREIIKELKPQILQKKMKIREKYAKLQKMSLDPKLTRIIFQNLVSNAVKYTPDKGTVSITIGQDKRNLLIEVADNGYGIPKNQQDKIFKKLFRADNVREKETDGTGLGLYIVKEIIEEAGGQIKFVSEENKGTTFFIQIPLSGMKKKEGTKGLSPEAALDVGGK